MSGLETASFIVTGVKFGFDILKELVFYNEDKNKKVNDFRNLVKSNALFGFYKSWEIFSKTVGTKYSPDADNLLKEYAAFYTQVIIQGSEMLPEDLMEELEQFTVDMLLKTKKIKVGTFSDAYRDINELAEDIYNVYKNFDNYQFKIKS